MKKLMIMVVLVSASAISHAQISKAKLVASGLTCSMCSKSIYEALQKLSSVETVKANIKESSYSIVFKKQVTVTPDDLKKAVEDAGFSVAKLQVTINFDNVDIKNDEHVSVAGMNLHFLNIQPQTLSGEKTLTVLDKYFESAKEFKKYAAYTTMKCFTTGVKEDCCGNAAAGERMYHVTM